MLNEARLLMFVFLLAGMVFSVFAASPAELSPKPLPEADRQGSGFSLERALAERRSVRTYTDQELSERQIAQLCWAGQGITDPDRGLRTCPSAGATFPLELYVVLAGGVDHYEPASHGLTRHLDGDIRPGLQRACLNQPWVGRAPVVFIVSADFSRTARRYSRRTDRYVWMEVGHAGQNILLQAQAMGLGAVPVGAFDDEALAGLLGLPDGQQPLYVIPVGFPSASE